MLFVFYDYEYVVTHVVFGHCPKDGRVPQGQSKSRATRGTLWPKQPHGRQPTWTLCQGTRGSAWAPNSFIHSAKKKKKNILSIDCFNFWQHNCLFWIAFALIGHPLTKSLNYSRRNRTKMLSAYNVVKSLNHGCLVSRRLGNASALLRLSTKLFSLKVTFRERVNEMFSLLAMLS